MTQIAHGRHREVLATLGEKRFLTPMASVGPLSMKARMLGHPRPAVSPQLLPAISISARAHIKKYRRMNPQVSFSPQATFSKLVDIFRTQHL
jgi:hypothetical protein